MGRKANSRTGRPQAQKLRQTNVVKGRGQGSVTVIKRAERAVRTIRKIESNTTAPGLDS